MEKLTLDQFLAKFDPSSHEAIKRNFAKADVTHVVLFENLDMWSSHFSARSALSVGPDCTYKTLADVEGKHLNDLPSQRQYPQAYVEKP